MTEILRGQDYIICIYYEGLRGVARDCLGSICDFRLELPGCAMFRVRAVQGDLRVEKGCDMDMRGACPDFHFNNIIIIDPSRPVSYGKLAAMLEISKF